MSYVNWESFTGAVALLSGLATIVDFVAKRGRKPQVIGKLLMKQLPIGAFLAIIGASLLANSVLRGDEPPQPKPNPIVTPPTDPDQTTEPAEPTATGGDEILIWVPDFEYTAADEIGDRARDELCNGAAIGVRRILSRLARTRENIKIINQDAFDKSVHQLNLSIPPAW